jgi:hypothetical protein
VALCFESADFLLLVAFYDTREEVRRVYSQFPPNPQGDVYAQGRRVTFGGPLPLFGIVAPAFQVYIAFIVNVYLKAKTNKNES